jgi:hypothetical protein
MPLSKLLGSIVRENKVYILLPSSLDFPSNLLHRVIGVNDAVALGYVLSLLKYADKNLEIRIREARELLERWDVNFICIGGSVSNEKTAQILNDFSNTYFTFNTQEHVAERWEILCPSTNEHWSYHTPAKG